MPYPIEAISPGTAVLQLVTSATAWHYRMVPVELKGDTLVLLISDVSDITLVREELELILTSRLELVATPDAEIAKLLSRFYRRSREGAKQVSTAHRGADNFLETLIAEAEEIGSSDIHIEIYSHQARVRYRIDGHLVERYTLGSDEYPALVNRIKIKANLDISEKRLPQDGRIEFSDFGKAFDIRVSILPTLHGEKVVLRLLSRDSDTIDIEQLGMSENEREQYLLGIKKPQGMILISGPTGSGKTTTLYATLKLLNDEKRNVLTIEHPIEYTLDGINQVQLREEIGLTFPVALRSFLRQDPDVIMVGEIRDAQTAEMAVRAALTGHLVLSTIHTNSAWGIVSRLIDMGIPPFLLSDTLNTAVAQRLVRKLCKSCCQPIEEHEIPTRVMSTLHDTQHNIMKPVGCDQCFHTGYLGRIAIYEIVNIDDELSKAIKKDHSDVGGLLEDKKVRSLKYNAVQLLCSGVTSIEEVFPILISTE